MSDSKHRIEAVLGPEGAIASRLEDYELRPQQLDMARAVLDTLERERHLIVEAGTGTGKTLAYLIPSLLSGKRVIVSTGSKALQEQLFHKDLPFLQEVWDEPFDAVLLKGRRNYLCKARLDEMLFDPKFRAPDDALHWPVIESWATTTEDGDRAEVPGLPDDYSTWSDLSIGSEGCTGSKCKHYETCFVTKARRRAQEAKVVVVNHHLFLADLALRDTGFGEILPEADAVVFDEAHHLEELASEYFGKQASNWRVSELTGDIRKALKQEGLVDDDVDQAARLVTAHGTSMFTLFAFGIPEGRYPLTTVLRGRQADKIAESHREFASALTDLERALRRCVGLGDTGTKLAERAVSLKFDVDALLRANDERYIYLLEIRDRGVYLQASPIDLAELMRKKLLEKHDSLVFTSATLSTGNDFSFFKRRMGMAPVSRKDETMDAWPIDELLLGPVFDYAHQSLIYVPKRLPVPNDPKYMDGFCQIVRYLVGITGGRAFILFTSWANMRTAHERLAPELADELGLPVYIQGSRPKAELIDVFREEPESVLFATSSFWEGVDVPGDALQLVVIDKLPFASPSDPLNRARMDLLESRGGNSFRDYSVPQAALTLKQGFGRLIRKHDDTGVVAILDSRITKKRYGQTFLDTLPPAPIVWRATEVKHWWHDKFGAE